MQGKEEEGLAEKWQKKWQKRQKKRPKSDQKWKSDRTLSFAETSFCGNLKSHSPKPPQDKKNVHLNKFFWAISAGVLSRGLRPGRNYICPPIPPFFGQKAFLRGSGGGCIFWTLPRKNFILPPPLNTTPTPKRVFLGMGGWGCIKIWPPIAREAGSTSCELFEKNSCKCGFYLCLQMRGRRICGDAALWDCAWKWETTPPIHPEWQDGGPQTMARQCRPKPWGNSLITKAPLLNYMQTLRPKRLTNFHCFTWDMQYFRKRVEYGFGEYGFKHRTQWVFRGSLSSGEQTQWVPLSLLFVCQSELTEFFAEPHRVCPETQWGSVSSLLRNSTLETVFRPFPIFPPIRKLRGPQTSL